MLIKHENKTKFGRIAEELGGKKLYRHRDKVGVFYLLEKSEEEPTVVSDLQDDCVVYWSKNKHKPVILEKFQPNKIGDIFDGGTQEKLEVQLFLHSAPIAPLEDNGRTDTGLGILLSVFSVMPEYAIRQWWQWAKKDEEDATPPAIGSFAWIMGHDGFKEEQARPVELPKAIEAFINPEKSPLLACTMDASPPQESA